MAIRAVVFDIGGVLEITPDTGWVEKWEKILHLSLGEIFQQLDDTGRNSGIGTCTEEDWLAGIRQLTAMSQLQMDAFIADFWHWYLGTPNTELFDYFRSLRPRYGTALLSNSALGARHKEQERYQLEDLVDFIVYSHEVGLLKPDRRIYELTCARLQMQPDEIVFLDDAAVNIAAARELGIHGILFKDTTQAITEIEACLRGSSTLRQ